MSVLSILLAGGLGIALISAGTQAAPAGITGN